MKKNSQFKMWNISIPMMYQLLVLLLFLLVTANSEAQVGINSDNSNPDPSAMLDIKSTNKGMLVPRMSTAQRTAISNPASGLLVYDNTANSFWFYNGSVWEDLSAIPSIDQIADADDDTKIQVEESVDEDKIRFDVNGTEAMIINNDGNIGINTSSPSELLDIRGGNLSIGNEYDIRFVRPDNSTSGFISPANEGMTLGEERGGTHTYLTVGSLDIQFWTDNQERMRIKKEGNIGIGTANPNSKLDVKQGDVSVDNGGGGFSTALLGGLSTSFGALCFRKSGTRHAGLKWDGHQLNLQDASISHNDPDLWSGIKLMTWDFDNSRVGIGTDSPRGRLDLAPSNTGGDIWGVGNINFYNSIDLKTDNGNTVALKLGANGYVTVQNGPLYMGDYNSGPGKFIEFRAQGSGKTQGIEMRHGLNGTFHGFDLYTKETANSRSGFYIDRIETNTINPALFISRTTGNFTIGSDQAATRAKVEILGTVDNDLGTVSYLSTQYLPVAGEINPPLSPYSLYATGMIAAQEFHAHSDERIKQIKGISDSRIDLEHLMQIEVTDYSMRDSLAKGNQNIKKVIAQQVAEVYPQAVTTNLTEIVPDIYQQAKIKNGWIMLATDLQPGERVKLITETKAGLYEVLEVESDRFWVKFSEEDTDADKVFVYGREVDDFHTVDYEAISMLNVSATQELAKQIELLKAENEALKAINAAFESRFAKLEAALQNKPIDESSAQTIVHTK